MYAHSNAGTTSPAARRASQGIGNDRSDVCANRRTAPDPSGLVSSY